MLVMSKDEMIGFGLLGVIGALAVLLVAIEVANKPIRKNGKCVNGLVYSVDKDMNPTYNRLDADGKPQRCTEDAK